MQSLLISSCLLGNECKYCGGSNKLSDEAIAELKKNYRLVPVCPEVAGGLSVPRDPSEIRDGKVYSSAGRDVTEEYQKGAMTAVKLAEMFGCCKAVMKQSSPSCGSKYIYDGTFTGRQIPGNGIAVRELKIRGIKVMDENEAQSVSSPSIEEILSICDHTLLRVDCTAEEIRNLCDQAIKYHCASVCIPPAHVAGAKRYVGNKMRICTVIGFPNGYMTSEAKAFEAKNAIKNGADEIDMVINLSMVKDGAWENVKKDIMAVRKATAGKILKVIIECCLLTDDEKVELCDIVSQCHADYIKTSTGFSKGGATFDDVELMRLNCPPSLKIKAAGGISSLEDAAKFMKLGASRLGTSRIVKIAIEQEKKAEEIAKSEAEDELKY